MLPKQMKTRLKSFGAFKRVAMSGHRNFYIEYRVDKKTTLGEHTLFDSADAASFVMAELIFSNRHASMYLVEETAVKSKSKRDCPHCVGRFGRPSATCEDCMGSGKI